MRRLLLVGIVLALLAVGGLGGAAMLGMGPLAKLFGTQRAEALLGLGQGASPPPPVKTRNIPIGSFSIPIIEGRSISRQVALDLELQVDPGAGEKIAQQMTRLQNLFLFRLYELMPRHPDPNSPNDRQVIHDDLLRSGNALMGEPVIRDVVIKAIYLR